MLEEAVSRVSPGMFVLGLIGIVLFGTKRLGGGGFITPAKTLGFGEFADIGMIISVLLCVSGLVLFALVTDEEELES